MLTLFVLCTLLLVQSVLIQTSTRSSFPIALPTHHSTVLLSHLPTLSPASRPATLSAISVAAPASTMPTAFALSTPVRRSPASIPGPTTSLSPTRRPRFHAPPPARMRLSFPRAPSFPVLPFPRLRLSYAPLSSAARLQRLSSAVLAMHLPALALLLLRLLSPAFLPLPALVLPERLLLLALLVISPELAQGSYVNLRHCAVVAVRGDRAAARLEAESADNLARRAERLAMPVRVHSVLTSVVAAGTLAGLFLAPLAPASGAQVALLFQLVFYLARRVRFERKGKVYRCDRMQYRDIVWAYLVASLCVAAVQLRWLPTVAAACVLVSAVVFWILKWVFVPSEERAF